MTSLTSVKTGGSRLLWDLAAGAAAAVAVVEAVAAPPAPSLVSAPPAAAPEPPAVAEEEDEEEEAEGSWRGGAMVEAAGSGTIPLLGWNATGTEAAGGRATGAYEPGTLCRMLGLKR